MQTNDQRWLLTLVQPLACSSMSKVMENTPSRILLTLFKFAYLSGFLYFFFLGIQRWLIDVKISTSIEVNKAGFKWPSTIGICPLYKDEVKTKDLEKNMTFQEFGSKDIPSVVDLINVSVELDFYYNPPSARYDIFLPLILVNTNLLFCRIIDSLKLWKQNFTRNRFYCSKNILIHWKNVL